MERRRGVEPAVEIPTRGDAVVEIDGRRVQLTNLDKPFWPTITKGRLIRYYLDVAWALLPHVRGRAMVMKRYPNGAAGDFFFMKRSPPGRPPWVRTCAIGERAERARKPPAGSAEDGSVRTPHDEKGIIDFPVVDDRAGLAWVVNLGCIDLNPWYARCDAPDQPDYLHFDLDPVPGATFSTVREAALVMRDALTTLGMPVHVKTTGSRGLHLYVPIARGPSQRDVWRVAKAIALLLAHRHPKLLTAEYKVAARPRGRVLVDYNQNAWGRTLASVYSVRPTPLATVSAPLTFRELERGASIEDFRLDNLPARLRRRGDLWAALAPDATPRFDLAPLAALH